MRPALDLTRLAVLLLAVAGCDAWLPSLPVLPDAGVVDAGPPTTVHSTLGADGWRGTVDATAIDALQKAIFTGLDLDTGLEAPLDGGDWDLAFGRSNIRTHSGHDGDGGVETAVLLNTPVASVTRAPSSGYLVDQAPIVDGGEPVTPFDNRVDYAWYIYDGVNHILTPKPTTYVVKSTAARFYALELLDYYDAQGRSAVYSLHWVEVPAP
jgi:hypothetical protein